MDIQVPETARQATVEVAESNRPALKSGRTSPFAYSTHLSTRSGCGQCRLEALHILRWRGIWIKFRLHAQIVLPWPAASDSAKLKLIRAAKHIRALKRCIAKYSASKPHKIISKPKRQKQLNVPNSPSPEISVLAGEAVYQMRSALDHLAFELVQVNPNVSAIDPDWRENTQFPLTTEIPKGCKLPLPKANFTRDLPGISDKAFTFIETLQPYYRIGAVNGAMGFLVCPLISTNTAT